MISFGNEDLFFFLSFQHFALLWFCIRNAGHFGRDAFCAAATERQSENDRENYKKIQSDFYTSKFYGACNILFNQTACTRCVHLSVRHQSGFFPIVSHWYLILKFTPIFFFISRRFYLKTFFFMRHYFVYRWHTLRSCGWMWGAFLLFLLFCCLFYEWESMNCILCVRYVLCIILWVCELLDWIIDIVRSEFVRNSVWNDPSIALNGIPMRTIDWLSIT